MKVFLDIQPDGISVSTPTEKGRIILRTVLTRDEAIGTAARLLELALRLPSEGGERG